MKEFAIVVLFVIVLAIQHPLNWLYRQAYKDIKEQFGPVIFGTIMGTGIALSISYMLIKLALEWYSK